MKGKQKIADKNRKINHNNRNAEKENEHEESEQKDFYKDGEYFFCYVFFLYNDGYDP